MAKIKKTKSQRISVDLDHEVYQKLANTSGITDISQKGLINQALRKFFGMTTPTIEASHE